MFKRNLFLISLLLLLCFGVPLWAQDEMAEPGLSFGDLSILNSLPLYVAQEAGYFDEAGVLVELVRRPSAVALQSALVAEAVDGFQADLISPLLLNASGGDVRVVRRVQMTNMSFIALVTGPESELESVADLAGRRIGISRNTMIQYQTDGMLASVGMSAAQVEYVDLPDIQERFEQLMQGQVAAAAIPAPLVQVALSAGGRVLIDDSVLGYQIGEITFGAATLAEKGAAVRAFLSAYERAVAAINAEPEAFREVMVANIKIPESLHSVLTVPTFSPASALSEGELAAVQDWMVANDLLEEAQAYEEVVDGSYLPEMMEEDMAKSDDSDE